MRKRSFISLCSFMEELGGTSASPPAPRNAWRVRLCGARSAVLEPSRAKALPQPAPLSPSKPPITPLKRAAHRGLTPNEGARSATRGAEIADLRPVPGEWRSRLTGEDGKMSPGEKSGLLKARTTSPLGQTMFAFSGRAYRGWRHAGGGEPPQWPF